MTNRTAASVIVACFVVVVAGAFAAPAARAEQLSDVGLYLEVGGGGTHVDGDGGERLDFAYPMGRFGMYLQGLLIDGNDGHNLLDIDMSLLAGAPLLFLDAQGQQDWDSFFYPPSSQTKERVYGASRLFGFRGVATFPVGLPFEVGGTFTPLDWGIVNVWQALDGTIIRNGTIHGSPFFGIGIGPAIGFFPHERVDTYAAVALHGMVWPTHDYFLGGAVVGDVDVFLHMVPDLLDIKLRASAEHRYFRHSESIEGHVAQFTTGTFTAGLVLKFGRITGLLE